MLPGGSCVRVSAFRIAIKQAKRNECIQEIACTARMKTDVPAQRLKRKGAIGQRVKYPELNRAKKSLGFSEGVGQRNDALSGLSRAAPAPYVAKCAHLISTSVMLGKAMMSDTRTNSASRNGTTPLKVSIMETSLAMLWMM